MKFKTATLLAIVGVSLILCLQSYSIYENVKLIGKDYDWINKNIVITSLWLVPFALLLVFFIVLYKNQKNK